MNLTDEQWKELEVFFKTPKGKRGRPPIDSRLVLNGILWILRTGAQWKHLPRVYPPYQTCHRWFSRWNKEGKMKQILKALARDLRKRGGVDIEECFIDGMFVPSKKGAMVLEKLSGVKARNSWALQTMIVYLSPYAQAALHLMKSNSLKKPSAIDLPKANRKK